MGKVIKRLILFFIVVFSLFAGERVISNEIIKENPKREVTTVESEKVRDSAKLSLSITKVTPEELMGKLEDGKLSVFIPIKNKLTKDKTGLENIDVKNIKLKAYSNPKLPDGKKLKNKKDIETFMTKDLSKLKDNVKSKLKENPNKEKNIRVVEKTDEYVKVEVDGVTEKEKIYISVMNGDEVVKSYRIGEVEPRWTTWTCWFNYDGSYKDFPNTIQKNSDKVIPLNGRGKIENDSDKTNSSKKIDIKVPIANERIRRSGIYKAEITQGPVENRTMTGTDDFFPNRNITLADGNHKYGFGMWRLTPGDEWVKRHNTEGSKYNNDAIVIGDNVRVEVITGKDGEGGDVNGLISSSIVVGSSVGGENKVASNNPNASTTQREGIFRRMDRVISTRYATGQNSVDKSCRKETFGSEESKDSNKVAIIVPVTGFSFHLEPDLGSSTNYPGIYTYPMNFKYYYYDRDESKKEKALNFNYTVDVGDVDAKGNFQPKILKREPVIAIGTSKIEVDIPQGSELSLMTKDGHPDDEGGIWYGEHPFYKNESQTTPEKAVTQSKRVNNGNKYIDIWLEQTVGEFAKLYINPSTIRETTTFKFTLWQGRKLKGSGEERRLRQIDFEITIKISKKLNDIVFNVDSRIGHQSGDWLNSKGELKDNSGRLQGTYSEMVESSNVDSPTEETKNKTIKRVEGINGNTNLGNNGSLKYGYLIEGKNKTALPYGIDISNYFVSENNDKIVISKSDFAGTNGQENPAEPTVENSYVVEDTIGTFWGGKITENYIGDKLSNTSSGNVDIGKFAENVDYSFAPGEKNPQGNQESNVILETEKSLDGRGVLKKNKDKNIITKLIIKNPSNNNSQTISGIEVGKGKIPTALAGVNDNLNNNIAIGINASGGLILKKISSTVLQQAGENIKIEYFHGDAKLGEFTLNIKSSGINIGEVKVEIDERLTQIKPSWIKLDGTVENGIGTYVGKYNNFINITGSFNGYQPAEQIRSIKKVNGQTPRQIKNNYYGTSGENESAFPSGITMEKFAQLGEGTPLYVSKWDVKKNAHNGKNDFVLEIPTADGKIKLYEGKLTEDYKGRETGSKVVVSNPSSTAYNGTGTLDLTNATVDTEYAFPVAQLNNVDSTPTGVTLKMTNGKSLDATGVVTKTSQNIANKIRVKVGNENPIIRNEDLNVQIFENKLEVGINTDGQLTIKKLTDENISLTDVVIEYYYDIDNSTTSIGNNAVKLGTFTLKVKNSVVDLGEIEVEIDERLKNLNSQVGQWLFPNGKIRKGIAGNEEKDYSSLFKFGSFTLGNISGETIEKVISMEGREIDRGDFGNYRVFTPTNADYTDEGAAPKSGNMSNFNNMITVSKTNGTNTELLNNKFKLQTTKENGEKKIYKGNIKEKFVGTGTYDGSGKLSIKDVELNKKYIFNKILTNGNISSTDNSLNITSASGNPINSFGLVRDKANQNIANRLKVEFTNGTGNQTINSKTLEATYDGITVGVDSTTGGMSLTVTNEDTTVTQTVITYYYDPDTTSDSPSTNAVTLGTFTLTVQPLKPVEAVGDITFSVDPRLKQISSVELGKVSWLTGGGNFGGWDSSSRTDYSNFSYVTNGITSQTVISDVSSIERKVKSSKDSDTYITFNSGENTYNEIAIKKGIALNLLATSDNLMLSPAKAETFATIFRDSNRERYSSNISLSYVNSVEQGGYTGTGTLDMSNGAMNTEYTFTTPASGTTSTSGLLSMTVDGTFPNTYGVVTGKTNISVANKFEVAIADTTNYKVTEESGVSGNSLGKWKVQAKDGSVTYLYIELTKNNELKLTKANHTFDFSQDTNKLILKYKNATTVGEITLGTFDLKINSTRTITQLGTVNVNLDERISQVYYSTWIRLDGDVGNFDEKKENIVGNFKDFISVSGSFSGHTGTDKINNVESINNITPTKEGSIYKVVPGDDETAIPFKTKDKNYITMEEFVKTGENTVLLVSKWKVEGNNHTGENEFVIAGVDGNNTPIAYSGNIKENYKKKGGDSTLPITSPEGTAYSGEGTLDLTNADIETEYSFTAGGTGNINSTPTGVVLNIPNDKKSLDATGVVAKTNQNIANKIKVKVGSETPIITTTGTVKTNILNDKLEIGINGDGQLIVKKLIDENIDSTQVTIDYYYDVDNDNNEPEDKNSIKLGTFTLTVKNTVIDLGEIEVEIDERLKNLNSQVGQWLFPNGKIRKGINGTEEKDYSNLFQFGSFNLGNIVGESIDKAISMEDRPVRNSEFTGYEVFLAESYGKWEDEGAIPKVGSMSNFNNLITVSKLNRKIPLLDNKFKLQTTNSTGEKKIYKGNIKEKFVGTGIYSGVGKVDLSKVENGKKYIFQTTITDGTITSDNGLTITNATDPVNSQGLVGDRKGQNIANKIKVEFTEKDQQPHIEYAKIDNVSSGTLETTYGNLTVGIDVNSGGLTLQKSDKTKVEKVKVSYYYEPTPTTNAPNTYSLLLGEFELEVKDDMFEIDGDNVLDFGKMFYRENDPFETREKIFKIKNPENKKVNFSVNSNSGQMNLKTEGSVTTEDKIDLKNIQTEKITDTSFSLQATAVLTPQTKTGNYEGEIEVIVTVLSE